MDHKHNARVLRGFTTPQDDAVFSGASTSELATLLESDNAQHRTSAAKIIGKRKTYELVQPLCNRLGRETALYAKLAICEALVRLGPSVLGDLIPLLGAIGDNQHRSLPEKQFKKDSYPLPRDIIARTICRLGTSALPALYQVIQRGELRQIREAVDAIGFITFYSRDAQSPAQLLGLLHITKDEIVTWKIIRALSAYPAPEVQPVLLDYAASSTPAFRREAQRSLRLIKLRGRA